MKIEFLVGQKGGIRFYCKKCDYTSRDKYDWNRHILTRKHRKDNKDKSKIKKSVAYHCMLCGRTYKYQSGLSKHKSKYCKSNDVNTEMNKNINIVLT